jgi:hypothetical protein
MYNDFITGVRAAAASGMRDQGVTVALISAKVWGYRA